MSGPGRAALSLNGRTGGGGSFFSLLSVLGRESRPGSGEAASGRQG